jgi:hypothetical protein
MTIDASAARQAITGARRSFFRASSQPRYPPRATNDRRRSV